MDIIKALKELSQYHEMSTRIMTPSGKVKTLAEVWKRETSDFLMNQHPDPNDYEVSGNGIDYLTADKKYGGRAYKVEGV